MDEYRRTMLKSEDRIHTWHNVLALVELRLLPAAVVRAGPCLDST